MNTREPLEMADDAINKGTITKVEAFATLQAMKNNIDIAQKSLKEAGLVELVQQYGKEGIAAAGYRLTFRQGNARTDYTGVRSVEAADKVLKDAQKAAKAAYTLANSMNPQPWVDHATGEVLTLPTVNYDADTIVATPIKEEEF